MYDHPVKVRITVPQLKKLGRGQAVIIKHEHLGKGINQVHLHDEQRRRMLEALRNRRGMKLHFSPDQVRYHDGKGFWDRLKGTATKVLEDKGSELLEKGLNKAGDYIIKKVVGEGRRRKGKGFLDKLKSKATNVFENKAADLLEKGLNKGSDYLINKVVGSGRRRKGKGFLDSLRNIGNDIGNRFNIGGVNPFQEGYNLGHDVIGPALLGKGKRKVQGEGILDDAFGMVGSLLGGGRRKYHKTRGGALFPPGYAGSLPSDKYMVENGIQPFVSGTPAYYTPYNPRDSYAVKIMK